MQNVSIFATATAQNSHKNFHQFYLPKNLCHGGTQKEVEQVSELHTCKEPKPCFFDNSPKVWRYDQCISGFHLSFKHINLQDLQLEFNLWIEPQQNPALDVYHLPQIRCLLIVSSDKFSCNGPGKGRHQVSKIGWFSYVGHSGIRPRRVYPRWRRILLRAWAYYPSPQLCSAALDFWSKKIRFQNQFCTHNNFVITPSGVKTNRSYHFGVNPTHPGHQIISLSGLDDSLAFLPSGKS